MIDPQQLARYVLLLRGIAAPDANRNAVALMAAIFAAMRESPDTVMHRVRGGGLNRMERNVEARAIAWWVAVNVRSPMGRPSTPEIARATGAPNHSSVLTAVKRIDTAIGMDRNQAVAVRARATLCEVQAWVSADYQSRLGRAAV